MHSEYFEIGIDAKKSIDNAKKVLAVGTTVTRTIEYYARTNKIQGECDLFLNPANKPIKVDYLLTNFHLPKSTLIMFVYLRIMYAIRSYYGPFVSSYLLKHNSFIDLILLME